MARALAGAESARSDHPTAGIDVRSKATLIVVVDECGPPAPVSSCPTSSTICVRAIVSS